MVLYFPASHFGFVNLDDQVYVTGNPHVNRGVTAAGVKWAFETGYAANWHPLTWLSHMVDCQIFGGRAGGHHTTSVMLSATRATACRARLHHATEAE